MKDIIDWCLEYHLAVILIVTLVILLIVVSTVDLTEYFKKPTTTNEPITWRFEKNDDCVYNSDMDSLETLR